MGGGHRHDGGEEAAKSQFVRVERIVAEMPLQQSLRQEAGEQGAGQQPAPLRQVDRPVIAGEQEEGGDLNFPAGGVVQLPPDIRGVMIEALLLNPMHHARHVIGQRVPLGGGRVQRHRAQK